MKSKGKVFLVGSGCGNIDLLTLKAKRVIETADCIVYDRLIDMKILDFAKSGAELIYLGKENTEGGTLQELINQTLVQKGLEGKVVARVKGGDSFVFGRGGEEIEALLKVEIPFELIPGISSSIAVPEYAGIPVTHRGVSKSFHIFTGHTMADGEWHDFSTIAKLDGTLVFLMGIKNLPVITKDLMDNGKKATTPVAIIESGATAKQRVTVGTLENISQLANERAVKPPAIIVVGEVVALRESFEWFEKKHLFKKSILVTRDTNQSGELVELLKERGAYIEELPFIEIEECFKFDFTKLSEFKVVLFNSPNGVKYFFKNIPEIRLLGDIKIGAVGRKTKELLSQFKIIPDFMPEEYLGERLVKDSLNFTNKGDKILFVTSDISPTDCENWSKLYNREFKKVVAYKTKKKTYPKQEVIESLKRVEYLTFFSSSTVRAFDESIENEIELVKDKKIISIGPVTTQTLKELGYTVYNEAKRFDVEGVVSALGEELNV